jgi:hypothetical protein
MYAKVRHRPAGKAAKADESLRGQAARIQAAALGSRTIVEFNLGIPRGAFAPTEF